MVAGAILYRPPFGFQIIVKLVEKRMYKTMNKSTAQLYQKYYLVNSCSDLKFGPNQGALEKNISQRISN